MKIFQLFPGFSTGDAISGYALQLNDIFKELGYDSYILAVGKCVSMDARKLCGDYVDYEGKIGPGDIAVYHFSIGSELTDFFKRLKSKKVLIYHNITPPHYFYNINSQRARDLEKGIEEIKDLRDFTDIALGVSEFDRNDLFKMGFKNTGKIWLLLGNSRNKDIVNEDIINKYNDKYVNIMGVGRICPNKKFEDIMKVFYYYKNTIENKSRLFIVGSIQGGSSYMEFLRGLGTRLGLNDIVYTGHVTDGDLNGYYKVSDIFITMSEHEGFCVPLLEAMYFEIPIIAYGSSAIPETLGGAGVCVYDKDYSAIAELIDVICKNGTKRKEIIETQNKRLRDFDKGKLKDVLVDYLGKLR